MAITDILTKEERSALMAKVKGKNTKPEIAVRKYLFSKGFRFRINAKNLPGTPDIVLPKYKTAIFVHGCFWHGHQNCRKARLPTTNLEYWKKKIPENTERDQRKIHLLEKAGWHVITIWQCEINSKAAFERTINRVIEKLDETKKEQV